MPPPGNHGEIYRFGAFELAAGAGELRKNGLRLKLQDQPIRLLILLLENAGEVVTRDQIQKRLWADDVHVDYENAINSAVRKLREVLVDTSENPRYVETLAKRGYRFIAPVSTTPTATVAPAELPPEIPIARKRAWLLPVSALAAMAAIGGAALWFYGRTTPEAPLMAMPLTSFEGREVEPSFSPDGNSVAFAWDDGKANNFDIYVQLIGSGGPLRLTHHTSCVFPVWSPDGRSIAFKRLDSDGNSKILLVPSLGGAEREIAQLGKSSTSRFDIEGWSPDGRRLLIAWTDKVDEPSRLFWISVDAGEARRLTSPPAGTPGDRSGRLSPDGRVIAFTRSQGTGLGGQVGPIGDLYTLGLNSDLSPNGEPKRVTFDNTGVGEIAWTGDSREIVFSSSRGTSPALWRVSASGSERPRRLEVGENGYRPAISGRSKRLVYEVSIPPTANIWRMDLSDPAGPAASFIASTRSQSDPQYSPDGKRIVFRWTRSGTNEIWACDADGSNPVQLTAHGISGSPRWSPDSRSIAFDSSVDGRWQIFVMGANGGHPQQLTHGTQDSRPSWSHDGKWLYFASTRSGRDEIWKIPSRGGAATQVTRNGGTNPAESEDGTAIYYDSHGTIMKASADGSGDVRVVDSVAAGNGRNFALVKGGIFYRAEDLASLWFLSLTDSKSRRILKSDKTLSSGFSVSPDGHWLLYSQVDGPAGSDLMLVENFH